MPKSRADQIPDQVINLESGARRELAVPVFTARISPPVLREGIVERTAVLDRLLEHPEASVVAIIAPPGYGKTTLLAMWAERDPRPFAWLTLDRTTEDPPVLLTHLALALDDVIEVEPTVFEALAIPSETGRAHALAGLARSVARAFSPFVVVIDDCWRLQGLEGASILRTIVEHLPSGSQLALADRSEPKLPVARWRSEGTVLDIGLEDLSLDMDEARGLLSAAGLDLPEPGLADVVARTEGWAAGLHFVALARNAGSVLPYSDEPFSGSDPYLVDYFRSEFLERLPDDDLRFLIRTSVLDQLCGPLCDASLERTGSAAVLEATYASNLFVVPLDRQQLWYRYHHLFREMLRHELDRLEPGAAAGLTLRASRWCEDNGFIDEAIHYAQEVGSVDQVGHILLQHGIRLFMLGRIGALQVWFAWLADHGSTDGAVAVLGAQLHVQSGKASAAEQWARVAEAAPQDGIVPDGSTLGAWVLTLRAEMGLDAREMQANAERALELLAPMSPFLPGAVGLLGIAMMMQRKLDEADRRFVEAVELGIERRLPTIASSALAFRAMIALRRGRWNDAGSHVEQAMSLVHEARLQDYPSTVLVNAVRAHLAADRSDARTASEAIGAAEQRLELLTNAFITRSIEARIELTHAYLGLGEARSAAHLLLEVRELLGSASGFDLAQAEVEELSAKVEAMRGVVSAAVHLTPAELRLFPYLATQLSFREISENLFLSIHTIKAEVTSIYRKLGVSSRTQAIERAREIGLMPPPGDELGAEPFDAP